MDIESELLAELAQAVNVAASGMSTCEVLAYHQSTRAETVNQRSKNEVIDRFLASAEIEGQYQTLVDRLRRGQQGNTVVKLAQELRGCLWIQKGARMRIERKHHRGKAVPQSEFAQMVEDPPVAAMNAVEHADGNNRAGRRVLG